MAPRYPFPVAAVSRLPLRTKDFDFLLLTGCSCLLTLLYHPVLDQLQGQSVSPQHKNNTSTRSAPSHTPNPSGLYSALEAKRPQFKIEEDETA